MQFGRVGYVTLGTKPAKLDKKAIKCVMIGYSSDHPGDTYRMYNPLTKKVINSRNIRWADWHGSASPTANMTEYNNDTVGIDDVMDNHTEEDDTPIVPDVTSTITNDSDMEAGDAISTVGTDDTSKTKTSKLDREMKKLGWTSETVQTEARRNLTKSVNANHEEEEDDNKPIEVHFIYSTTLASDPGEPRHYKNAISSAESGLWIKAIKEEIQNFYKRDVWKKVPRSVLQGKKPLGNRWVFKKKAETDGSVRYKARVVVKGYTQIPGVDFTDSYAPVATDSAMRTVFALVLYYHSDIKEQSWTCEVVDVEAAFLEAEVDNKTYIEWPEGVQELGFESSNVTQDYCIQLGKAMYGTVPAALQWFNKLVKSLKAVGLTQSKVDPCIFYLRHGGNTILVVATHVDDCAVAGKPQDINDFKQKIKKQFTIKELGKLSKHLGVWYTWGSDVTGRFLESGMEDFVLGMFEDFKTLFSRYPKMATTPALPGTCLRKNKGEVILHGKYRSMVGKILYFVKKVSPICANACRELSQHLDSPGESHWCAVERLLGFLRNDPENRKLKMRPPMELRVQDVVDSSFADNPDTRKSTSAYLGTIGGGALVNWISKGQKIVTMSSTESEYVSLSDGAKETTFVANLLGEINTVILPSMISEDNTGAIFLSGNKQVGGRTKHIDTRYHFIREKVENGTIIVSYVNTVKNPSDLLSKNVTQKIHDTHAFNMRNGTLDCWNRESVKM